MAQVKAKFEPENAVFPVFTHLACQPYDCTDEQIITGIPHFNISDIPSLMSVWRVNKADRSTSGVIDDQNAGSVLNQPDTARPFVIFRLLRHWRLCMWILKPDTGRATWSIAALLKYWQNCNDTCYTTRPNKTARILVWTEQMRVGKYELLSCGTMAGIRTVVVYGNGHWDTNKMNSV
jgi:hypothetical protein